MKGHYLPLATIAWGISLYFLFGNLEFLGGHTGLTGIPALGLFGVELRNERYFYFLIWGIAIGRAVGDAQPARFAAGARDPRAARPARDGRGLRRGRRATQDRRLRLRGAACLRLRLALRASAALRESDAVRHQPGHRVPVHGGRGRCRQRVGGRGRRHADHAGEAGAAGRAADAARQERQLRDRRLRRADGHPAAARARGCVAMDRTSAAGPSAAARAGGRRPAGADEGGHHGPGARGPGRAQAVRRPRRRQRSVVRDSSGRDSRPHRTERRRQEHDVQPDLRCARVDCRGDRFSEASRSSIASPTRSRAGASGARFST